MTACFHCGLAVPEHPTNTRWNVTIDQIPRAMCCPGCAAAAQTIVDFGLTSYYQERSALPAQAQGAELIPEQLRLYDAAENLKRYTKNISVQQNSADSDDISAIQLPNSDTSNLSCVSLSVEGLRCAACSWLIERRLHQQAGVTSASMNLATERMVIQWDTQQSKLSDLLQAIRGLGYQAYPSDPMRQSASLEKQIKTLQRQLFVAGLSMMQVMMYAVPAYLADDGTLEADMASLMRWASLLLTLPAIIYSARPFFSGAWNSLKNHALGMDVPVTIGIGAAFLGSLSATLQAQDEVYFDSVTMFIFLLLASRYVELMARRKATASLEKMQHGLPASAARLNNFPLDREAEIIPPSLLKIDDIILVKPGEVIPADAEIIEGESAVDVSLLTGESAPLRKYPGDLLPGGAINAYQALVLKVKQTAGESTLSVLLQLIDQAALSKPRLALWADTVASWFVLVLLLFAAAVWVFWHFHDPLRAWPIAIAVLVVSCPCALSLATPTALAAGTDSLLRQGVLIVRGHALETLQRATHVIFDKTGTLTLGRPVLEKIVALCDTDKPNAATNHSTDAALLNDYLQIAALLETSNAHPIAAALLAAAREKRAESGSDSIQSQEIEQLSYHTGQGISAIINGKAYRLGSASFVAGLSGDVSNSTKQLSKTDSGNSPVYLGTEQQWLARFEFSDGLREDAQTIIQACQKLGKNVILLSGDQPELAQYMGQKLGISEAYGGYLPEQKLDFLQHLQQQGAVVAMVGDGINDAAVMSAADVSFAMGSGAALAQAHADGILLGARLSAFGAALSISTKTMQVVRQNLIWASCYNLLAIPAAALGIINPWISGVGMSLSSLLVVFNALRLRRIDNSRINSSN